MKYILSIISITFAISMFATAEPVGICLHAYSPEAPAEKIECFEFERTEKVHSGTRFFLPNGQTAIITDYRNRGIVVYPRSQNSSPQDLAKLLTTYETHSRQSPSTRPYLNPWILKMRNSVDHASKLTKETASLPTIILSDGTQLDSCRATKRNESTVTVMHSGGVKTINVADLSEATKKNLKWDQIPVVDLSPSTAKNKDLPPGKSGNTQDIPNRDKRDDDGVSGSSLDLAKYAKEAEERKNGKNQAAQNDFGSNGFKNSLGMKFVRVPITGGSTDSQNILFSIWETRRKDYRKYAEATNGVNKEWENPKYTTDESAPVIFVTIRDAEAFCSWLTKKERGLGIIPATLEYRLPTDHEWSCAVGIGHLENPESSPASKEGELLDIYPWGNEWPIPKNIVEKYTSAEAGINMIPVGSLPPNKFGVHDMNGNVFELCMIENGIALGRGSSNANFARYARYMKEEANEGNRDREFEFRMKQEFASSSRFIFEKYDEEFGDLFINPAIMLAKANAKKMGASFSAVKELMIKRGTYKENPDHGCNDCGFRCVLAYNSPDADKGYDYYDCKATYTRLKRQVMMAKGLKKKGMLDDDAEMEMVAVTITAIIKTDWSKCSPRLREKADKVRTTFELVGKKLATNGDLAESVKSLNEITDEVSKNASKNQMFVNDIPNIIDALERELYRE